MKHSAYIGRVGALAVALGIGAAVATNPGLALAQDSDSGSANAGTESSSSSSSSTDAGTAPGAAAGASGSGSTSGSTSGSEGSGAGSTDSDPPSMNVSADTTDTSTNDDGTSTSVDGSASGAADDAGDAAGHTPEISDPTAGTGSTGTPTGGGSQGGGGESGHSGPEQTNDHAVPQQSATSSDNEGPDLSGAVTSAGGGADDNTTGTKSFKTAAVDSSSSGAATFNSLAVVEQAAPSNPIADLIALPFRIVSSVLTAIVGGPSSPAGENPLFLGLLAYVRRAFAPFERTFSNQAPVITGALVDENEDGSFTITVRPTDASDPDGDDLTFTAVDGAEGTVVKTGVNTFKYTPGDDFDGDDTVAVTASDPGGLFGINRKSATVTVNIVAADDNTDPTQPEDPEPPVQQDDGTVETQLQFDPAKVTDVTIAPGSEPKYYTYEESYNEETGEYELHLTPTQAGQLRAALGLDTTDTVGLQVTTAEAPQQVQTFALRSASFAALDAPDYTVNLPDIPAGHFVTGSPILTSPHDADPTKSYPAGVAVTDRYAYVMSSHLLAGGGAPTVSVIGADPTKADYLQVIKEIPIDGSALLVTQSGDRLYIASGSALQVIDTDGADPVDEADDNTLLDPIELDSYGAVVPVASPDGKTLYVINQALLKISVVDIDPANTATYNTVIDEIPVADPATIVDNGDGTNTVSGKFPLSAAFNADGTRMYVVRDSQTYKQNPTTNAITDFTYGGEIITIDTATNEIIGNPVTLEGDYGYFASSDGKYLYVPALTMNGFDPTTGTDIAPITGAVNIIDIQDPDNPVVVANLPTGKLPVNVAFSPDKSLAYVVDAGTGNVFVIDTVNQEVLDLDPIAAGTQGLVFDAAPSATLGQVFNVISSSPDGSRLFVTNFGKGTVVPIEFVQNA